jgi:hypothetical protein
MEGPVITTIDDLHTALQEAVALEFSTIPVYLSGWWTIDDPTTEAAILIQSVMIVEMRHMAVAANTLIATGGTPNVTSAVQSYPYPTYLPDGEKEFEVNLLAFGPAFLEQAMWIEQPTTVQDVAPEVLARFASGQPSPRRHRLLAMGDIFPTIGQFYEAIISGIQTLVAQLGESTVFPDGGNTPMQLDYFGTQNITVTSSEEAIALLTDIVDEGEGASGTMWDENQQLSHFYTFQEISLAQAYEPGDQPGQPTGPPIAVPTGDQVANMWTTPKMSQYPQGSEVWNDADAFNQLFAQIVGNLDLGFSGSPAQVQVAVGQMIQLPAAAGRVLANPFPGEPGWVAGPTFELPPYTG